MDQTLPGAGQAGHNRPLDAYWMPFTSNRRFKAAPKLLAEAKGMYYRSDDGREVLDGTAGLWCCNAGHGREEIAEAVYRQLQKLDYAPSFQLGHPIAFEFAERLTDLAPEGYNHVFFTGSGSESADTAMKIALAYHRARGEGTRTRFIGRERGYHGVGFGGMSVGGIMGNRRQFMQWIGATALLGAIFVGGQWVEYRELSHLNLTLQRSDLTLQDEIFESSFEIVPLDEGYEVTILNQQIINDLDLSYDTTRFLETTVLNEEEYAEFEAAITAEVVQATSNFGMRFYAPTAFHGAHVVIGVLLALHVLYLGSKGFYDENPIGVELFGLYWHFVDVVWILLFTLIYLV